MARRQLDASFWDDPDVAQLCAEARLLLICMITDTALTDDNGVLPADASVLKKHAFGYDDIISVAQVAEWRDAILAHCRNVVMFTANGRDYIYLRKFTGYQGIRYRRKSNYPAPPEDEDCAKVEPASPKPDCGNSAANCRNPAEDCANPAAVPRGIPALDEMSRGEVRGDEVSRGGQQAPPAPEPSPGTTTTTPDPLVAQFFTGLQRLGVLIASPAQAEAYRDVVERIRGHPQVDAFITQLFDEAAKATSGRITPRWFEVVVDRCLREGRMPGERPPGTSRSRDAPQPRYAGPTVDWDEVQAKLARTVADGGVADGGGGAHG